MISLSTTWGRGRFGSYPALFLALRERFPAFELSLPAWPGCPVPQVRDFRTAGVRGTDVVVRGEEGPVNLTAGLTAARTAGIGRLAFDGLQVQRPGGWGEFTRVLDGEGGTGGDADEILREGLAWRRDNGSPALEDLARILFDLTRGNPDMTFCLQTPPGPTGLPSPRELQDLLGEVGSRNLGYCHVAGRAAFLESVAGWDAREWLEAARDATVLAVLDDGGPGEAGKLPGTGTVRYGELRELLPGETRFILRPGEDVDEALFWEAASFLASFGFE